MSGSKLSQLRDQMQGQRQSKNILDISGDLTDEESRAAGLAAYLDQLALGYGTPALAALMSLDPNRGTYQEEKFLAENLQRRLQTQDNTKNLVARGTAFLGPTGPINIARLAAKTAAGPVAAGIGSLFTMLQGNAPEEWVPVERKQKWKPDLAALYAKPSPGEAPLFSQPAATQPQPPPPAVQGEAIVAPLLNSQNPEVQFSPNMARAYSSPVDPAQEAEQLRDELRWRSWNSPRGQDQALARIRDDAALKRQIELLTRQRGGMR